MPAVGGEHRVGTDPVLVARDERRGAETAGRGGPDRDAAAGTAWAADKQCLGLAGHRRPHRLVSR